jgi:hypothetical protein
LRAVFLGHKIAAFAHALITPERSVGVGSRIGTAAAYLECAIYDWIRRCLAGRNGFYSRLALPSCHTLMSALLTLFQRFFDWFWVY